MKKLIALLLAAVTALSLVACNANNASSSKPSSPTSPTVDPATLAEIYRRESYTGTPEDVVAARDTVVATMGGAKLTNAMLQLYYWMDVYDFLNYYNGYVSSYGLDITKPLDKQNCGETGNWQHYFLGSALDGWKYYQALALVAEAEQLPLTPERQEALDGLRDELVKNATEGGFASVDAMIQADAGPGCTADDYVRYTEIYHNALNYSEKLMNSIEVNDEMIEAFFTEHEADLAVNGIKKNMGDCCTVRHILIEVGKDKTSEDWETCRQEAQKLLNQWLDGEATEDSFAAMAKEHSQDPGSKNNGGKYAGLTDQTNFVQEFKDWYLVEGRKTGDYGLVKTSYGYHVMYFAGTEPIWYYYCRESLIDETFNKLLAEAVKGYEPTVSYDKILLGEVKLTEEK